jgi:hypothetical protein
MVDFVKFTVRNFKEITTNPLLDFREKMNTETGQTEKYKEATYKGLKFVIKDTGYLIVTGSLHKYYNEGDHNHNDFSFTMLQLVIEDLVSKFHFNVNDCYINNIEFGVNIKPVVDTQLILQGLLTHKNIGFDTHKKGHYKQAQHKQYFVKVYDKAKQYGLSELLIRYELKFVKMERLKIFDIITLSDLQQNHWIDPIKKVLLMEWNEILLFDKSINIDELNKKKQLQLHKWNDSSHWMKLDKSKRYRELKEYKSYVNLHSDLIQEKLSKVIGDKWIDLYQS